MECVHKECVRQTYPIQEAAGPEDHFPPEHQMAEGETDRETKQIRLGHLSVSLLPSSTSLLLPLSACPHCTARHEILVCPLAFSPPHEDEEEEKVGKKHPKKIQTRENQ